MKITNIILGVLIINMSFSSYGENLNSNAKSQCSKVNKNSDRAILCAMWENSQPVIAVHQGANNSFINCDARVCTKALAEKECKSMGFTRSLGFTGKPGLDEEIKTNGIFTGLWCQ